ncbi:Sec20 domain-containing protein [Cephalotus follicularis]|uniref:Sec20 domain-containing protein n=1 Tax=Cephalotus follicularis TaxID=3775 RepID=A0A1Q3C493_CEPFO|nr:Sec20 domain-containing protein [Cephalotus follicularis]
MDEVVEEVEKVKKEWEDGYAKAQQHINAIQNYTTTTTRSENSLARLNALAHDSLALLNSLHFKLDLLSPQLPDHHHIKSAHALLHSWHNHIHNLRLSLRNANLQAKANIRKTAQEERELLLGGGEESTIRRRNLQTKAGMTSAAESITESLRRSRQLMVQEVERSATTLMTFEESTGVLKKAESEYKGHRSLLMRTRNLLSTMQRQDVLDRVILIVGFVLFSCAVLYVVSKRIGVLKLQRQVTLAIKAGMAGQAGVEPQAREDSLNLYDNAIPKVEVPLEQPMHDEL